MGGGRRKRIPRSKQQSFFNEEVYEDESHVQDYEDSINESGITLPTFNIKEEAVDMSEVDEIVHMHDNGIKREAQGSGPDGFSRKM